MVQLSIVIPTMNESGNIHELLTRTITAAETIIGSNLEIIFVDDGSDDGTRDQIRKWRHDPRIKLIHRRGEKGLASAILDGAKTAKGEILLIMDAYLSHPPESIPDLVQPILKSENDMVVGRGAVPFRGRLQIALDSVVASVPAYYPNAHIVKYF